MQKTTMVKAHEASKNRKWFLIDATDLVLGRLAVASANILRGKNKPNFTLNVDCGDNLIIINTDKIKLTGNKEEKEFKYNHSGFIGGLRKRSLGTMVEKYSDELVYDAIKNMLPGNRLSRQIIKKLYVYKGPKYDQEAQKPEQIKIQDK